MTCKRCSVTYAEGEVFCKTCGQPLESGGHKSRNWILIVTSIVVVGIIVLWISAISSVVTTRKASKPVAASAISEKDKAELQAMQNKMCKNVRAFTEAGVFTKIESGTVGVSHAYVDRAFHLMTVDEKKTALGAVATCHVSLEKKDQLGLVIIHNGYTGKRIGTYSFLDGLELD